MGSWQKQKKPLKFLLQKLDYLSKKQKKVSLVCAESAIQVHWNMALSVPYHPYNTCLICGSSYAAQPKKKQAIEKSKGQEWVVEWWPMEGPLASSEEHKDEQRKGKLLRCSGCKQAPYCSHECQKLDWNVIATLIYFQSQRIFNKMFDDF